MDRDATQKFLGCAFRNINLPPLSVADLDEITEALAALRSRPDVREALEAALETLRKQGGITDAERKVLAALAALDNPEPSAEVKGEAFQRLVDLHDALVLTREHNPQTSVASLVDSSSEFRRARDYLHSHQYDGIDCAAASSAEVNALVEADYRKLGFDTLGDFLARYTYVDKAQFEALVESAENALAGLAALAPGGSDAE